MAVEGGHSGQRDIDLHCADTKAVALPSPTATGENKRSDLKWSVIRYHGEPLITAEQWY